MTRSCGHGAALSLIVVRIGARPAVEPFAQAGVVLRLMQGEPAEGLSRRLGLPVCKLEEWRQRGLAGIDAGLRERDEEISTAVRAYFERYNQHWLLEKNGYRSPAETRRNWMAEAVTIHEAA